MRAGSFGRVNLSLRPATSGVAVLPFENLSGDSDNAYFVDGMQEEILTRLASIAGLKVISRNSTRGISEQISQSARDRDAAWRSEHY